MKEKEADIKFDKHPLILYVEKEDGTYARKESASYLSHHYLDDYFDKKKKWDNDLKEKMNKKEISPVYYFMIMLEMGEGDLASRVGISRRKLKRHFKMSAFEKMSLILLNRYADVFDIPVATLTHFWIRRKEKEE
jgi:hypothetical protein